MFREGFEKSKRMIGRNMGGEEDNSTDLLSAPRGNTTTEKTEEQHYIPTTTGVPSQQSKQAHMLHKAKIERKLGSITRESAKERDRARVRERRGLRVRWGCGEEQNIKNKKTKNNQKNKQTNKTNHKQSREPTLHRRTFCLLVENF